MKKERKNRILKRISSIELLDLYVDKFKEKNLVITDIQIDFNEQQQIDIKIKGKEKGI